MGKVFELRASRKQRFRITLSYCGNPVPIQPSQNGALALSLLLVISKRADAHHQEELTGALAKSVGEAFEQQNRWVENVFGSRAIARQCIKTGQEAGEYYAHLDALRAEDIKIYLEGADVTQNATELSSLASLITDKWKENRSGRELEADLADEVRSFVADETSNATNRIDLAQFLEGPQSGIQEVYTSLPGRDSDESMQCKAIGEANEILTLAALSCTPRQKEAIRVLINECLASLQRVLRGQIRISDLEGGYFARFFDRVNQFPEPQSIKAFIRITAFEPEELCTRSWFPHFYKKLSAAVREKKVVIEYIFLLRTENLTEPVSNYLSKYKSFAKRISIVSQERSQLEPETLRPSIVLFESQQIAFTHDRGDDNKLVDATEWVLDIQYKRLKDQYERIEFVSTCIFDSEEKSLVKQKVRS
jgi:hypothetical protein